MALAGLFSGILAGWGAGLALFSLILPASCLSRRLGWPTAGALLTPLILPILFYAILHSTWVTLRQGGICWRDTFYPLEILRQEGVR